MAASTTGSAGQTATNSSATTRAMDTPATSASRGRSRSRGREMPIPAFRDDGYLPEGLHEASEEEVIARFGEPTPRREYLTGRLRRWLELARSVGARRLVLDGSFVTDKA